ncbi:hypothetical protein NM208_g10100 [Fusarium decemcellulare]|uniref:Uncharacterized protein n=1 Tax=Fusarium decemcellulare TaxID=57161 RepID=A0ACC1RZ36_9HYPO|nr:hypothetical protein NM208_g10100 [Fusarium decemcellulare]
MPELRSAGQLSLGSGALDAADVKLLTLNHDVFSLCRRSKESYFEANELPTPGTGWDGRDQPLQGSEALFGLERAALETRACGLGQWGPIGATALPAFCIHGTDEELLVLAGCSANGRYLTLLELACLWVGLGPTRAGYLG